MWLAELLRNSLRTCYWYKSAQTKSPNGSDSSLETVTHCCGGCACSGPQPPPYRCPIQTAIGVRASFTRAFRLVEMERLPITIKAILLLSHYQLDYRPIH
jgi:hypothetical protein